MSWDPFQRQVLAELGHALYVRRDAAVPSRMAPVAAPIVQEAAASDHPMLARMARAAGLAQDQLLRAAPDLAQLAGGMDGAAKRALWPRLRGLRRDMLRRDAQ